MHQIRRMVVYEKYLVILWKKILTELKRILINNYNKPICGLL